MKDYKYEFKYTKENGLREATLSSKLQDKLFQYRKSKWNTKYIYFVNEDKNTIIMARFTPLYLKIFLTLLYPILLVFGGIVNYKQLNKNISDMWYEKERGTFSCDDFYRREKDNTLYEEVMKNLKFKEG